MKIYFRRNVTSSSLNCLNFTIMTRKILFPPPPPASLFKIKLYPQEREKYIYDAFRKYTKTRTIILHRSDAKFKNGLGKVDVQL